MTLKNEPTFINLKDDAVFEIKDVGSNLNDCFVLWMLGTQCTYSCSYCPDYFHNGLAKYQPTETIQKILRELPPATVIPEEEPDFHCWTRWLSPSATNMLPAVSKKTSCG